MAKSHIAKEKKTVALMIKLYCRRKEKNKELCPECQELLAYAHDRLENCRFGENKCACLRCPAQCYKPEMKERIKQVMRFSGPHMLYLSPIAYFRYFTS